MNRRLNDFIGGALLMPFMALVIVDSIWLTHGWILIAIPLMIPATLFHDFSPWWPSKTHCMTCIERTSRWKRHELPKLEI